MKLLVFGATGQLGGALAAAAAARGLALDALDRQQADLADPAAPAGALAARDPDLVVNAAAYTAVDKAESEPDAAFAANAEGPGRLAAACAARGLPLVHISTDYVFDGSKPTPYGEDDPVAPLGVYGRSKAAGEQAVRAACPRHLILRTSWVYAAEGRNFVRTMLRLAEERDSLSIVADQRGCPTAAADLAETILDLAPRLLAPDAAFGTFHAAGSGITSWHDFAREIFRLRRELTGRPAPAVSAIATRDYPTPAPRPLNSALDCSRLAQTYGLALPPWPESLARVVARLLDARAAD